MIEPTYEGIPIPSSTTDVGTDYRLPRETRHIAKLRIDIIYIKPYSPQLLAVKNHVFSIYINTLLLRWSHET
jgi:hypothetical protein